MTSAAKSMKPPTTDSAGVTWTDSWSGCETNSSDMEKKTSCQSSCQTGDQRTALERHHIGEWLLVLASLVLLAATFAT